MNHRKTGKELENEAVSPWLDTETKALLQQVPREVCTGRDGYVHAGVAEKGNDLTRLAQALTRCRAFERQSGTPCLVVLPLPVARSLSLSDALLDSLNVCSDSISVFLRDEVVCPQRATIFPNSILSLS